jgi:hypothetical protein
MAKLTFAEAGAQIDEHVAAHDAHGYSQPRRTGDGTVEDVTLSNGWVARIHGGDYDCSSLIWEIVMTVLQVSVPWMWTGNERATLLSLGFRRVTPSWDIPRGTVLLRNGHTEMFLGGRKIGGPRGSRYGNGIDGPPGDQSGTEIMVSDTYNPANWTDAFIWPEGFVGQDNETEEPMECLIQPNGEGVIWHVTPAFIKALNNPDQMVAVQQVYRACHGRDIPCFAYGEPNAPFATRLLQAYPSFAVEV